MRRLLILSCALLLALAAAPALAQDPDEPVGEVPTEEPDDGILDPGEIPPESTPFPEPCPPGAPLPEDSPDADYYYYCDAVPSAGEAPEGPRRREAAVQPLPAAQARQLPLTGHDPLLVGLFGAGFLLAGAGLRLRLRDVPRR